jgi:flagellar biogenesis protein FliO
MFAMQVWLLISGLFYLGVIPVLFISWLEFFRQDEDNLTQQEQKISMFMIAIASLFWIIALPFAYIELLDKFKRSSRAAQLYQKMLEASKSQQLSSNDEVQFSNH